MGPVDRIFFALLLAWVLGVIDIEAFSWAAERNSKWAFVAIITWSTVFFMVAFEIAFHGLPGDLR
jgi:hypothetical protein